MKVHELLSDERKWTRGARGRDADNKSVGALSKKAVKWCANGAIEACYRTEWKQITRTFREVVKARYGVTVSHLNDGYGYAEVLSLFKELNL